MGFRVPTLKHKYWIFYHNYAAGEGERILYGNPDLKPKRSHGGALSGRIKIADAITIDASGYFNYITNLIDSVVTNSISVPQIREEGNIDTAMTFGGELDFSGTIDRFEYTRRLRIHKGDSIH